MDYKKQLVKFDIAKIVNISFIMFLVSFIICGLINLLVIKNPLLITDKVYWDIVMMIGMLAALLVIHELLHAFGAIIAGKCTTKDIKFGVNIKQGMLYCHIMKPLKINDYKFALILPLIITGIIPLIISTIWGNIFMVLLFSFMVSGGAGDLIMLFSLSGYDKHIMVLDHEAAPAYYLLYKDGTQPDDFVEVTSEMEENLLENMKKSPYATQSGKEKNIIIKTLFIAIFCSIVVLGLFVIAILMEFC
jgi:hypothetical protein